MFRRAMTIAEADSAIDHATAVMQGPQKLGPLTPLVGQW